MSRIGKKMRFIVMTAGLALLGVNGAPGKTSKDKTPKNKITGLSLSGEGPIAIDSHSFEIDQIRGVTTFKGNVSAVQGSTLLKTDRMTVYYDDDAGPVSAENVRIRRLELDGGVYVKSGQQVATGDRGTFDMQSEILTLSGKEVVLSEGKNRATGCELTARMPTGQVTLKGCKKGGSTRPVKMILHPETKNRQ